MEIDTNSQLINNNSTAPNTSSISPPITRKRAREETEEKEKTTVTRNRRKISRTWGFLDLKDSNELNINESPIKTYAVCNRPSCNANSYM